MINSVSEDIDCNEISYRQSDSIQDGPAADDVESDNNAREGGSVLDECRISLEFEPMRLSEHDEWAPDDELIDILKGINA